MDPIARQAVIRLFSWLHTPQTGIKRNKEAAPQSKVLSAPLGDAACWRAREALHGQELWYECVCVEVGRGRNKPVSWK